MNNYVLEVSKLIKDYGSFRAVNDISFKIPKGKIVGFLGPNGAGKTTTIQMLLGITSPTSGKIEYFGKDFAKYREASLQRINFTSAFNTLLGRITARENMIVYAKLYGLHDPKDKINELLHYFEIADIANTRYQDLSTGQKTRINFAKSLLNDPEILLMDEPTASLDPDIADKTLTLIESLKKDREISILYTSHNMNEITRICDEVIILDRGSIVAHDSPVGLTKMIPTAQVRLVFDNPKHEVEAYLAKHEYYFEFENKNMVVINTEEKLIPKVIFGLSKAEIWITNIDIIKPSLEDVFLHIARKKHEVV